MIEDSSQQQKTLQLICETICPSLNSSDVESSGCQHQYLDLLVDGSAKSAFLGNSASSYQVADQIIRRVGHQCLKDQKGFSRILRLIETPVLCSIVTGRFARFSELDQAGREAVLRRLRCSRLPALRGFFQSIKRMTLFLSYAILESSDEPRSEQSTSHNRTWASIGYSGTNPLNESAQSPDYSIIDSAGQDVIETQILIVGSGAGGSVAAANLAARGYQVLIAEKGRAVDNSQLGQSEFDGNRQLFDKMGGLATRDLGFVILSGSTVGGGTTVNWMTCLDTPRSVRESWAREFGFEKVLSSEFDESMQRVKQRLSVGESLNHNRQNQILLDGCQNLGYQTQPIPRNTTGCNDCQFCNFGCRAGCKQDTRQTFLRDAFEHGAKLLAGCEVNQLKMSGNRITHVEATIAEGGEKRSIHIRCEQVVVAGGAINTAALLLNSGLGESNSAVGNYLHLHPTTAIASFFEDDVVPWQGAMQSVVCDEFSNLDGQGYGVRLEVAPVHPGFGAMALAWDSAVQHKNLMSNLKRMANIIVLTRDKGVGQVRLGNDGQVNVKYHLSETDGKHMLQGVEQALRIHHSAGAELIVGPHQFPIVWQRGDDFEAFCQTVVRHGHAANSISLFSAHQMSTCRIGRDPSNSVFDTSGRSHQLENLFVADGSGLPGSCGTNPMITIMTLADLLSRNWKFESVE